jgi:kumamolisin
VAPLGQHRDGRGREPVLPAGNAGRGLPDVAADSAQESGYRVLVDGQWYPDPAATPDPLLPIGGTSAAAPLWAALVARLNQALGLRLGFLNPMLYKIGSPSAAFRDVALGNNGDYKTAPGWDPCTGLGTPDGQALLDALRPLVGGATPAPIPVAARS